MLETRSKSAAKDDSTNSVINRADYLKLLTRITLQNGKYCLQVLEPFLLIILLMLNFWHTVEKEVTFKAPLRRLIHPIIGGESRPDVLLVGATKCGSIPLAAFLNLHPSIKFSGNFLRFYNHDDTYFNKGVDWYRSQMAALNASGDNLVLDGNAAYFTDPRIPARVARTHPNVKILVILREPVQRILSDYAQAIVYKRRVENIPDPPDSFKNLFIDKTSGEANIVNQGMIWTVYVAHLRRWLRYFPREQIHVIDGEAFLNNPLPELALIEDFLHIPRHDYINDLVFNQTSGYYCTRQPITCYGHGKNWMRPYVDPETFKILIEFFRQFNVELFETIGRKFDWRNS